MCFKSKLRVLRQNKWQQITNGCLMFCGRVKRWTEQFFWHFEEWLFLIIFWLLATSRPQGCLLLALRGHFYFQPLLSVYKLYLLGSKGVQGPISGLCRLITHSFGNALILFACVCMWTQPVSWALFPTTQHCKPPPICSYFERFSPHLHDSVTCGTCLKRGIGCIPFSYQSSMLPVATSAGCMSCSYRTPFSGLCDECIYLVCCPQPPHAIGVWRQSCQQLEHSGALAPAWKAGCSVIFGSL